MKLQGNKYVNHSFFRPFLYIYDDHLVYTKRHNIFKVEEITMIYLQIVQVNLHRGFFFATLELVNTGEDNVLMKGLWKGKAKKARKIIDQKLHVAYRQTQQSDPAVMQETQQNFDALEKKLNRLTELLNMGKISKREFAKKKKELLKEI